MSQGGGRDEGDNANSNPSVGEVGARLQAGRRTRGFLLGGGVPSQGMHEQGCWRGVEGLFTGVKLI